MAPSRCRRSWSLGVFALRLLFQNEMSKHAANSAPRLGEESPLTDAGIEAILLTDLEAQEDVPHALEIVQTPGKGSLVARWLLMVMFGLVLVGSWVKP